MDKPHTIVIELQVPFHDVDSMQVVWHGHYCKYIELARCELLESFNYGYEAMWESGYNWPVVDMRLKFVKSAHFGQRIRITATLVEWEYRIKIVYEIRDLASGEKLTKGYTTQVAVDRHSGEMCFESPSVVAARLGLKK